MSRIKVLQRRAWRTQSVGDHLDRAASGGLPKVMGLVELTFLGLGSIIGAGVFVLSGVTAREVAGPAVVLSYVVAATAALLAGLSYAEFAVELPVAGGAFNFISITFGELAAWSVAWNQVLEMTLSGAAVARGFSSYLCTLVGLQPAAMLIPLGPIQLDFVALALIALLTAILAKGTKESMVFNIGVSSINLISILFVLAAGFPLADTDNLHPFMPFGLRGVFSASSIVFFAFIGFDYISSAAEEASNPTRDLPLSIISSLAISTLLYVGMALVIVMMGPYTDIDVNAPFSAAFLQRGMGRMARVVSVGAVTGIVTSTMTGLLSQARLFVVLGRQQLLPAWLARVHPRTETPTNASLVTGLCAGVMALLLDINILAELVSVGTLYVFWAVCCAVLFKRFHQPGDAHAPKALLTIGALTATSLAVSLTYTWAAPWSVVAALGVTWLALAGSLFLLPVVWTPSRFAVPLFPATPALGVLATTHLICSLGWPAYVRFAVWMVVGAAIYTVYGAHAAEAKEADAALGRSPLDGTLAGDVELPSLQVLGPEGPLMHAEVAEGDRAALLKGHDPSANFQ